MARRHCKKPSKFSHFISAFRIVAKLQQPRNDQIFLRRKTLDKRRRPLTAAARTASTATLRCSVAWRGAWRGAVIAAADGAGRSSRPDWARRSRLAVRSRVALVALWPLGARRAGLALLAGWTCGSRRAHLALATRWTWWGDS